MATIEYTENNGSSESKYIYKNDTDGNLVKTLNYYNTKNIHIIKNIQSNYIHSVKNNFIEILKVI